MRHVKAMLIGAVVFAALTVPAVPAGATRGSAETILLQRDPNASDTPGSWSASGAFADSGSWTSDFLVFAAIPSPVVFQEEVKTAETGAAGSFELDFQGHINVVTNASFGGTWQIDQGTGAYATLSGNGTWSRTRDPITGVFTFTCVGQVRFD